MDEQVTAQPLSPEQTKQAPIVSPSSKKPYFIAAGIVLVVFIICVAIYFLTDALSPKDQSISRLVLPKTTSIPSPTPTPTIPTKTEYSNPFDEKSQYTNPFSQTNTYANPFDVAQ